LPVRPAVLSISRPGGPSFGASTTVVLAPLDGGAADELLLRGLPTRLASDATLVRLRASAAGNPLFLIELTRAATVEDPTSTNYPATIERLLAARIDERPIVGRRLVRDASVLGLTVHRGLAARVLGRPELELVETWEREAGELIVADGDAIRFRHDLIRVAAYEGLSVRRRREVHLRAGDVIEEWGSAAPVGDRLAALAFHASGSDAPERVARWGLAAASAALEKGASEIAEGFLHDVVAAQRQLRLPAADRRPAYLQLAVAAERAGHPDIALRALTRATQLDGDPLLRAQIAVDRARILEKQGRYLSALTTTARALRACPPGVTAGHLRLARATIRNFQGRWSDCLQLSNDLIADLGGSSDQRLLAQAHLLAEWCCTCLGRPERAAHEQAALSLLTELDDSIGLANLLLNRGGTAAQECRAAAAIEDLSASAELYRKAGDVVGAVLADNNLAEMLTMQFRLDEAEPLLRTARRVTAAAGYPHGLMIATSGLSRIASWQGRHGEARQLQNEALAGFRGLQADDLVADSLVRLVEIHLLAGDPMLALQTADEAASAIHALGDIPVIKATLARLRGRALLAQGDRDLARENFAAALEQATIESLPYEIALATLGCARAAGDPAGAQAALAMLDEIDVIAPPPGS
jgi:tetratricopeptide (TPR) repeat protein